MTSTSLDALAQAAGVSTHWQDWRGVSHHVTPETVRALLTALEWPCASEAEIRESLARLQQEQGQAHWPALITARSGAPVRLPMAAAAHEAITVLLERGGQRSLPVQRAADGHPQMAAIAECGYHQLLVGEGTPPVLAVAPARAFPVLDCSRGQRLFGLAAQLYGLPRPGDGGIGDFGAVAALAVAAAPQGVDAIALSPAHALFAADPDRFAPYSPSSRLFLNPLHADPAAVVGESVFRAVLHSSGLAETYAALEALPQIDYGRSGRAKWRLLRGLWALLAPQLQANCSPLAQRFHRFCQTAGAALTAHARFEALQTHHQAEHRDWWQWQPAWRSASGEAVERFAQEHASEVNFHRFAQWLAQESLGAAQAAARGAGMRVGLIGDLAVGTDGAGSDAWSRPDALLAGVGIGAPPDPLAPQGQNWGLTTFSPRALWTQGFAPFLDLLRANLRHAGGLRIDHVLGLQRLWLVPEGARDGEGAYLAYPRDDLLRLVALESQRHRALIIGEDLGTLPAGFQEVLAESGVLGLRVLYFQREHKLYIEPARWSDQAVAMSTTHDLPTVAGFWEGRDLAWRSRLGLLDPAAREAAEQERLESRQCLWGALDFAGMAQGAMPEEQNPESVIDGVCRFVAQTPAPLALLPLEDVLGMAESPNLPGTTSGHPNWQQRLEGAAPVLIEEPAARARLAAVRQARGGAA
jgi:4-alpha-glucanotransferase